MKQIILLFVSCAMLGVARAVPIDIQISGTIDHGRLGTDPFTAVDIANLHYTVHLTKDTSQADWDATPDHGLFWGGVATIDIHGKGTFSLGTPDFLRFYPSSFWTPWASGQDAGIVIQYGSGAIGDLDHLHAFGPFSVTDNSYVSFSWMSLLIPPGSSETYYLTWQAFSGVWFESFASPSRPITVQAVPVPDTPSTIGLWGMGIAVLGIIAKNRHSTPRSIPSDSPLENRSNRPRMLA